MKTKNLIWLPLFTRYRKWGWELAKSIFKFSSDPTSPLLGLTTDGLANDGYQHQALLSETYKVTVTYFCSFIFPSALSFVFIFHCSIFTCCFVRTTSFPSTNGYSTLTDTRCLFKEPWLLFNPFWDQLLFVYNREKSRPITIIQMTKKCSNSLYVYYSNLLHI